MTKEKDRDRKQKKPIIRQISKAIAAGDKSPLERGDRQLKDVEKDLYHLSLDSLRALLRIHTANS